MKLLWQKISDDKLESQLKQQLKQISQQQKPHKKAILCRTCQQPITDFEQRIEIQGAHQHSYQNPVGILFNIACFRQATGCQKYGIATLEHTWFAGFRWRFAVCSQCHAHLGWFYQNETEAFYGLIIEQLMFQPTFRT